MPACPKVMVVRFGSLGDVILTTPLLRAIRRTHSDAAITFVTKHAYAPLLAHNPHVREVVTLDPDGSLRTLGRHLRRTTWDHRLDLHGSLRSVLLRALVPGTWRSYAKRRLRRALLIRSGVDRYGPTVPVAERYFEAARDLDVHPDGRAAEVFTGPDAEERARAVCDGVCIVLAPGAAHATKRWPGTHWHEVVRLLRGSEVPVVGVGTDAERSILKGAGVVDGFGIGIDATAALMRRAHAVVANDSGLMHLATAVGTPVVALYGPTVAQFGFFPYQARAVVLERPLRCRPCSPYGSPHCPLGHHRCMFDIEPEAVAAAVVSV